MLTINHEQWTKLDSQRRDGFIREMTEDFVARFCKPGEAFEFESVQAELVEVIAVGESWGLRSSQALYQHALASRIIGRDYADVVPETGSVVRSTALDDSTKAQWLTLWLTSIRQQQPGAH